MTSKHPKKQFVSYTVDHAPHHGNEKNDHEPFICENLAKNFELILNKYPKDRKQSAIAPILILSQVHNGGHITRKIINEVAEYIGVEPIEVFEVATFYSMFNHKPQGKYQICLCQGVSCLLNNHKDLLETLQQKLTIKEGEVTDDGLFSFKRVECLGACSGAPVVMIGDSYYENLNSQSILQLIENLSQTTTQ